MAGNPDFELVVGVDAGASFNTMRAGLADVIKQLNADPQKVKLEFDLKSGFEGFKNFQKQVTDGMMGLGTVLRVNMEQISDIGRQLDTIAKKDFTAAFDLGSMFKDDGAATAYKIRVRDYINMIKDAYAELMKLQNTSVVRESGVSLTPYFTQLEGFTKSINEVTRDLNITKNIGGLEALGEKARDIASGLLPLFEALNKAGASNFDLSKLIANPEAPVTAASAAKESLVGLSEAIRQIQQAMGQESGAVGAASDQYDVHKAAVDAAVEAEKLKGNISGDVKSKLEAEAGAAEKSAEAAQKDAKASEDAANAKKRSRKEVEQTDEQYYAKFDQMEQAYYAKQEQRAAEAAAKKEQQIDSEIAKNNAALDKEAADAERWAQKEQEALSKLFAAQDAQFEKLSSSATLDLLGAKLDTVKTKMEALSSNTLSMGENFRRLQDALAVLSNPDATLEQKQTAYAAFNDTLRALEAQIKAVSAAEKEKAQAEKDSASAAEAENKAAKTKENNLNRAQSLLNKATKAQQDWTKAQKDPATKDAYKDLGNISSELKQLIQDYDSGKISAGEFESAVANLNRRFTESSGVIRNSGNAIKSWFGSGMTQLASRLSYTFGLVNIVMKTVAEVKKMISTAVELDTAMNQLQIVTRASVGDMALYQKQVSQMAKDTAQSTKDLIDATTVYARLGYSLNESSQLAKYTAMLQGVGDVDASTAQNAMTAIVKAFDKDVSEIESIMDRMVQVGNNFPISVSDIAVGMNNAGSALSAAGNSFEQSIALLTAANTTIQNISMSSTGLRTIAARIRKTKVELDDLGETIEEAKYQEVIDLLTGHGVRLTENGEYRATYDILKDIADIWGELSSMERAGIAEQLAGTRQQNVFYSIIGQFNEASEAMDAMENSAGSLQDAYDIYLDSIQAHVNQLKAAFDELSMTVVNSDLAKGAVDFLTKILELLSDIVDTVGLIGPLLAGAGVAGVIKLITTITAAGGGIASIADLGAALSLAFPKIAALITGLGAALPYILAIGAAIAIVVAGVKAYKKAHPSFEELKQSAADAKSEVDAMNAKIDETQTKIKELNDLKENGGITEAQQAELDALIAQNAAYEEQKILLEQIAKYKQDLVRAEVNKSAGSFFSNNSTTTTWYDPWSGTSFDMRNTDGYGGLLNAIEDYANAQKRVDEINQAIAQHNSENEDDTAEALRLQNELNEAMQRVVSTGEHLSELQSTLVDWKAELIGATDEESVERIIQINAALEQIAKATGTSTKGFDDFKKKLSSLSSTVKNKLLSGLELTKDEIRELEKWLMTTGYTASDAYKYLQQYADELRNAELANNDAGEAIRKNIANLTSFKDEMTAVNAALEAYNKALENGEKGDAIASMEDIYKGAMEDFKAGKYDTNRVRAAAALFFSPEQLEAMNYDMQEVARQMRASFMQTLFDPDDKSDLTAGQRFVKHIMDNAKQFEDVAKVIDNGNGTVTFWYNSIEELADAFGMSTAAVAAFIDEWDAYGVEVVQSQKDWDELINTYNEFIDNGYSARDAIAAIVEEMHKDGSDIFQISQVLNALTTAGAIEDLEDLNQFIASTIKTLDEVDGQDAEPTVTVVDNATATAEQIRRNLNAIFSNPIYQYIYSTYSGESSGPGRTPGHGGLNGGYFAAGTHNAPSGPALVNELGPELISDEGRAYIANGGKPGFTYLHKGAIVFTADETAKIFKHAYANIPMRSFAGGTRNRLLSGGTTPAHAMVNVMVADGGGGSVQACPSCGKYIKKNLTGNCPYCGVKLTNGQIAKSGLLGAVASAVSGVAAAIDKGKSVVSNVFSSTAPGMSGSITPVSTGGGGGGGGGGGSAASQSRSEPQKIDWIAVRLNRIQRIIADLDKVASSGFKRLATRIDAAKDEIPKMREEIKAQQAGYSRYIREAESVGLSASLAQKVREGTIDINKYDDDTRKKIQEYQEWFLRMPPHAVMHDEKVFLIAGTPLEPFSYSIRMKYTEVRMRENDMDWAISSQAPNRGRFNDYPGRE